MAWRIALQARPAGLDHAKEVKFGRALWAQAARESRASSLAFAASEAAAISPAQSALCTLACPGASAIPGIEALTPRRPPQALAFKVGGKVLVLHVVQIAPSLGCKLFVYTSMLSFVDAQIRTLAPKCGSKLWL